MLDINAIKELADEYYGVVQVLPTCVEVVFITDPRTSYSKDCEDFVRELNKLKIRDYFQEYRGKRVTKFFTAVIIRK